MEPKVNYTLVGLFLAVFGAALLAGILWLSRTDYRGVYDRYYTYMDESVSGLSTDSSVRYNGVDIGRVKEIVLNADNPEQVRLALDLVRGTPIKEDTIAFLETQGLTGITTVNLRGGSAASSPLQARSGEAYPVIQSRRSFYAELNYTLSRLMTNEQIPALLANLNSLTQEARGWVDAQSRADLKRILADTARVTAVVSAHRAELANGIAQSDAAFERFAALAQKMDNQVPELLEQAAANLRSLQNMTDQIASAGASFGSAVDGTRADLAQFTGQTLAETGVLVAELRQVTATLQRLASDLEREPRALVFGRSPPRRGPGE
ncbi:MAG: putative ABC-type transport system, periplasmic binding component [Deltaproteobacteria bacterium]|nr:putative ABC-type transport system, periplasmic binding component [Deltaproteobacteria bacterium]